MANFRRLFSVTIVISLLLSIGVLFITQLAITGDGEGKPEESTLYEANRSWDGAEPNIDVDQDHINFECFIGGSTPNMAATPNQLDFERTTAILSSYETPASDGNIEMLLIDSPPTPPVNVSRTIVSVDHLSASAVILNDVPTSEWTYGCTATSAGMLFGYYDRIGYPNMYTGPTNGGVCPLTDLGQGEPTNPGYPIPGACYIIATENGLDGISSNAHVDDYWISYSSAGPDPWEGNWPEHTWGLCTADFLGTNQWKWDYSSFPGTDGTKDSNIDGATTIWTYGDGSKLYDWYPGATYGIPTTSCCHGMKLFAESRGYSVDANYNQLTNNQNSNGFTFVEFQSEINAGRPVLIHLVGHTTVGIGYDTSTNSIYIHDTWDNSVHSMTWGGSYAGMALFAVTVIHLAPPEYDLTISSTSGGSVTMPGEGTFTYDEGTVVDLVATPDAVCSPMVDAGLGYTVGLKSNGTVITAGDNSYGCCDVGSWTDIVQVATGYWHTVGLKSDGTVVAVGSNTAGECNVGAWTDIVHVAAGGGSGMGAPSYTVGLKSDGTVVAVGYNYYGQCNVGGWTDITQVAAGRDHTVGLKSDGTVVAVGVGGGDVGGWTNIIQVAAGEMYTVGLKDDGTVVAVGYNNVGQCNVGGWTDIVQVDARYYHTVGLKSDGTVVAVGYNDAGQCNVGSWTGIAQVAADGGYTLGLKADGTVVATGLGGGCDIGGWMLIAYRFVNWTGDVGTVADVNAAATTITMNGDYSITANFVAIYDLTISSTSGGSVTTPGEGTFTYDEGTVVDLVATPDAGYRFVNWTGDVGTIADVNAGTTTITMNGDYEITANFEYTFMVAAGIHHTVGLKSDGTVVAVGDNYFGQCNVGGWMDIVQVAAGYDYTVGVKSDGTVVAAGRNDYGQCNVGGWTGILQVAAGTYHTVGVKNDGTVVVASIRNDYGMCNVGGWTGILQVAAGQAHTVGVKSDGTVVAVGWNPYGQCNVGGWTGIAHVAAGSYHTVGVKNDGTVVVASIRNDYGMCNVGGWTGIVQVAAGIYHTVGLKSDGTVVAVGDTTDGRCAVGGWTGIVQVAAGYAHTVGVKSDGTVVAVGNNALGQCNVGGWTLVTVVYNLTIASTEGGSVNTPGEGTFSYDEGTVVDLVATPDESYSPMVDAGLGYTVGLKTDGTVVAAGGNYYGECNVGGWTDITQVAAGYWHTVGLKSDGTVVAVGSNTAGECNVGAWTDIVHVAAGGGSGMGAPSYTVGLKSDGTVVAVGNNALGQCNVGGWTDITQVAAGRDHTVGLKSDGTVVAVGSSLMYSGVGSWTDIVQVAAGEFHTVGLKSDGTVVAVGINNVGQCNVGGWTDIVQIDARYYHTVGLKSDGTVVAVGYNTNGQCNVGGWTGITQVAAGGSYTLGVKADGTVVATGLGGGCDIGGWMLFAYRFVNWTGDVGTVADVNAAATTITMNGDYSITANFVAIYDLTTSSTAGGDVTIPGEGTFAYDEGTVVDLVATPDAGYRFVNWTGDVGTIADVNAGTTTITMNGDYEITANFVKVYGLTTSSTAGGSVTEPGEGTFTYDEGTVVDLAAAPDVGFRFVNWTGNVGTIADVNAPATNITMNGDYSITANFVALYDLTTSSTAGGSVTTPGEGTFSYDEGTVSDLVAVADEGHRFVNWTGDVSTVGNVTASTTTITMNGDYSITANFVAVYDLSISSITGGDVTTPGEGTFTYDEGTVVDLVATPDEGYRFDEWTGDVGTIVDVNAAATTITINGDYSITAEFVRQYDLSLSSTEGGSVTTPGEGTYTYDEGTVVDLVATPGVMVAAGGQHTVGLKSDSTVVAVGNNEYGQCDVGNWTDIIQFDSSQYNTVGVKSDGTVVAVGLGSGCDIGGWMLFAYRFVNWTGDVGTIADVNAASTNITMSGDYSITANFVAVYDLTTSSTAGGSVTTPGEGTYTYDEGTVVDLVATPDAGYRFDEWTGDVGTVADVNDSTTTITMNGDYSITANFVKTYDLTTSSTAGGSVTTPGEGTYNCDEGTVVSLNATPDAGYRFDEWTGDVGTVADVNAAATTITMNGDYSITANFVKTYDLTTSSTNGGSVTDPGEGTFTYDEGTVVNLVATPGAGYCFVNWTGDVGTIADANAATTNITMNGDYSITANFVAVYDLTTSSTAGGSVTTPGEGTYTYDEGTVVDLVATPDFGYYFVNWTGDVDTIADVNAAATTITMNGDYSITANFAPVIEIWDWYDLDAVRDNLGGSYVLMNDLDSNTAGYTELASPTANGGKGWQPIGDYTSTNFAGTLDGQGYEIKDLFINRPSEDYVGLFGAVDVGGAVKNVGVVDGTVSGDWYVGGLVGRIDGIVSNAYSTCNVTSYIFAGGLVGWNNGTASNCSATDDVSASWRYAGGLAGVNQGNVSSCYATGDVYGGDYNVGGLVGVSGGDVRSCYATGDVTSGGHAVGGLIGRLDTGTGTVDNCYSTGDVSGSSYVGGLMGENRATVSNSYSTGKVNGNNGVGGLIGRNEGIVSNAYSTGSVSGSSSVGGLVGQNWDTVSNSFWDTQTSGQATSGGGTGKNTTEMKDITTFSGATWNITAVANPSTRNTGYIWNIVDDVTYPFLSWQSKQYDLTMAVNPPGGGTATDLTNASPYLADTVVTIQAVAAAGYQLVNWSAPAGTFGSSTAATTTFTMPAQNVTVTANFVAVYDLNTSSTGGGSITEPGEDTFTYDEGTVVDLIAEADACYEFINWTGDVDTIADLNTAATNITMNGSYSITANFAVLSHNLTTGSTDGGSVSDPGEGTFTYDCGTVVNLVAMADEGYHFVNWTGDVGTIADVNDPTTTITMNGDYSITANFVAIHDLATSSTAGGSVTTPGEGVFTYDEGTVVELVATPDAGYRFDEWTGDVDTIADVNAAVTTITMNGDYSITANFLDTAPPTGYGCASPEDEAECVSIDEALVCSTASDDSAPIEYKFAIATDAAFSQDLQESGWQQSTNWTPTTALSYGKAYWWRVKARDAKNNESAWSSPCTFVTIYKFDLALKSGWNMISLPLESCTGETDPAVILPDVEVIYTWNCQTTSYDSPTEIVPGKGYWALVFEDVTETIYGTPVEEYQLSSDCEGWHMVGSLYVDGQVNVGSGSVYGSLYHWNPETLSYVARPLDDARPGEGYWLLAFTDFSISVVPKPPVP